MAVAIVRVERPEADDTTTTVGLRVRVGPFGGSSLAVSVTLKLGGGGNATALAETCATVVVPAGIVCEMGYALRLKSGAGETTVKPTVMECDTVPRLPTTKTP